MSERWNGLSVARAPSCSFHRPRHVVDEIEHDDTECLVEIEERARPLEDKTADETQWRYRSHCGFLDENQSFLECVRDDEQLVKELHTSAEELAHHLRCIIEEVERTRTALNVGPSREISIQYTSVGISDEPQELLVDRVLFSGSQHSLFFNPDRSEDETETWSEEYHIHNLAVGLTIRVGGNAHAGSIHYIERFHFFQGGLHNEYRIDPAVLLAVLTGKLSAYAIAAVRRKNAAKIDTLRAQKNSMLDVASHVDNNEWTKADVAYIGHAVRSIDEELITLHEEDCRLEEMTASFTDRTNCAVS